MTVELGISEFTFGFAFLFEQATKKWGDLVAAPILPSLAQEAQEGWDAQLPVRGAPFFYQFKLSDRLSRRNANFIKDGTYGGPYFRIKLHKKNLNQQHANLRALSLRHRFTYYAAPEIESQSAFNESYLRRNLTNFTKIIPLLECDDIDDPDQHFITFQPGSDEFIQHSKTTRKRGAIIAEQLVDHLANSKAWRRDLNQDFARDLLESMLLIVQQQQGHNNLEEVLKTAKDARATFRAVASVCSIAFNVSMVLVGSD